MKNTFRVNELAEKIGVPFTPGNALVVTSATASQKELVADTLTKCIDIEGVEVRYVANKNHFVWMIEDDCPYGPDIETLRLQYSAEDPLDYDAEGYLVSPFRVLDGKDIDKIYGFNSDGNRSYCVPVTLTDARPATDGAGYAKVSVRPNHSKTASSILYIVEWGGSNNHTAGIREIDSWELLEKVKRQSDAGNKEQAFFYRERSNGGKQGIDYYVLPTAYCNDPLLMTLVQQRTEQDAVSLDEQREEYAKKLNLAGNIDEKFDKIKQTSSLNEMNFLLAELRDSNEAKAYYVDELKIDFHLMDQLLIPPTLDESFQSLKEKHDTWRETERLYHRAVNLAVNQLNRWKKACPYFKGFNDRIETLGGTMVADLYKIYLRLPSLVQPGKCVEETYSINRVQLILLDDKLGEYEKRVNNAIE